MWKFQLSIHPSIYNHVKIETIYCKIKWDDLQVNSKTQWKQKILMKWNKAQKEYCICRVFHLRQNSNLLIISACKKDRTLLMVASYSPWKMFFLWAFDNCFAIISSPPNLYSTKKNEIYNPEKKKKKCFFQKRGKDPYHVANAISWTAALTPLLQYSMQCTQTCFKTRGIPMHCAPFSRNWGYQGKIKNRQNSASWRFHYFRLRVSFREKIRLQNQYQKLIKIRFSRAISCNHEQSSNFSTSWDM